MTSIPTTNENHFKIGAYSVGLLSESQHYSNIGASGENIRFYVFQTREWHQLWRNTVGVQEFPIYVEIRGDSGQISAAVQLSIRIEGSIRILCFAGGQTIDYHAPAISALVRLDVNVLKQIIKKICSIYHVDVVQFRRMPENIDGILNPFVQLQNAVQDEEAHFARLPETFDGFMNSLGANFRKELRRRKRRLAESGEIRFEVCDDAEALRAAMEVLIVQKTRRWQETGSKRVLSTPAREFYTQLAALTLPGGRGMLCCLRLNGQIVATLLGVLYRCRFVSLLSGFESGDMEKYSLGRILKEYVVEWSISQHATIFDLTVGDEAYKKDWAKDIMKVYSLMYAVTLRGLSYTAPRKLRRVMRGMPFVRKIRDVVHGRAPFLCRGPSSIA